MTRDQAGQRLWDIARELGKRYIAQAELEAAELHAKSDAFMSARASGESVTGSDRIASMATAQFVTDLAKQRADIKSFIEERDYLRFAIEHDLIEVVV